MIPQVLFGWVYEEEEAKLYQEGEESNKEIKRKTKVGLLGSTLIYFHKGKRK